MSNLEKPLRIDTTILRILAACDPWLVSGTQDSHPVIVAFYVPAYLAPELRRHLATEGQPEEAPEPSATTRGHLALLED